MLASILRGLKDDVVAAGQRRLRDGEAVALGDAGKSLLCLGQPGEHTPVEPTLEPLLLRRSRPGTHTFAWRSKASRAAWQRPPPFGKRSGSDRYEADFSTSARYRGSTTMIRRCAPGRAGRRLGTPCQITTESSMSGPNPSSARS